MGLHSAPIHPTPRGHSSRGKTRSSGTPEKSTWGLLRSTALRVLGVATAVLGGGPDPSGTGEHSPLAGRRGRSGPVGNLNAARSILPALRRLRQGKPLPPDLARVTALADLEAKGLEADKPDMTAGERAILNVWRTARTAVLLILDELVRRGAVVVENGKWDLQPGTARLSKFLAEERAALMSLGLERRARDVGGDLLTHLRRQAQGLPEPEAR